MNLKTIVQDGDLYSSPFKFRPKISLVSIIQTFVLFCVVLIHNMNVWMMQTKLVKRNLFIPKSKLQYFKLKRNFENIV